MLFIYKIVMKNILRILTLLILISIIKTVDAQVYTNLGDVETDERALYTMTKPPVSKRVVLHFRA